MKEPDRARVHQAAGEYRYGHEHEHVERVTVVPQGAGQKAVVPGVVDGAMENPVEPEDAELLIELVFVALVGGDLDYGRDRCRRIRAGRNIVPGVEPAGLNDRHARLAAGL